MTNCKNCGAPLKDNQCEYCGTIHSLFDTKGMYCEEEIINFSAEVYRDTDGVLHRVPIKPIRKVTFIDY